MADLKNVLRHFNMQMSQEKHVDKQTRGVEVCFLCFKNKQIDRPLDGNAMRRTINQYN